MAKKDPDLIYILYLVCRYVTNQIKDIKQNNHSFHYIYIYNGRSGCFVLTGGSASDGSSAKRSAIFFFKCLKRITPKLLHLESNLVLVS